MSTVRYTGSNTATLSGLAAWINANKAGTFLENATVETTGTASGDTSETLSITLDSETVEMRLKQISTTPEALFTVKNSGNSIATATATGIAGSYNELYAREGNAILSEHCLLLSVNFVGNTYQTRHANCGLCMLTADTDGNLVVVVKAATAYSAYTTYPNSAGVKICRGANVISLNLTPFYNVQATSLAETALYNNAEVENAPYLYLATASQYEDTNPNQPSVCTVNGAEYVTNGRWYCK